MPMRRDAPRIHPNRQHLTGRSRMRIALCAVAGAAAVLGAAPALAASGDAPGDLDPTFGAGGKVTTVFGGDSRAYALVLQPNGKLVAAGVGPNGFVLVRYNPDGSLDTSFGGDGKVTTAIGFGAEANALALQPDGKLVAAGTSDIEDSTTVGPQFALVRYNPDGSLDTSFGVGGKVTTAIGDGADRRHARAFALALQPDGKLVAAGEPDFTLVRYRDGSLDTSFGVSGKVTTSDGVLVVANALALQPDGKLVAAGMGWTGSTGFESALVRYNPDGSFDTSFGVGGKVTTDTGESGGAHALALQPDGKLVAAGSGLIRYKPDGSLDTSFGVGGKVTTAIGDGAYAVVL